jgi:hypothetical protein
LPGQAWASNVKIHGQAWLDLSQSPNQGNSSVGHLLKRYVKNVKEEKSGKILPNFSRKVCPKELVVFPSKWTISRNHDYGNDLKMAS